MNLVRVFSMTNNSLLVCLVCALFEIHKKRAALQWKVIAPYKIVHNLLTNTKTTILFPELGFQHKKHACMHRSPRRSCSKLIVECWVTAEDADVHIWVKIPGLASEVFGEGRGVVQHCLILHKISLPLIKFKQYHSI